MRILGIDTATFQCSVGIAQDGVRIRHESLFGRSVHSENLLTLVDRVMGSDFNLNELDGIAVSIGPGSYTGLRIGLSTAKGLAFPYDLPLLPVPTMLILERVARAEWPQDLLLFIKSHRDLNYFTTSSAGTRSGLDIEVQHEALPKMLEDNPRIDIFVGNTELPVGETQQLHLRYPRGVYAALIAGEYFSELKEQSHAELVPNYMSNMEAKRWNPAIG